MEDYHGAEAKSEWTITTAFVHWQHLLAAQSNQMNERFVGNDRIRAAERQAVDIAIGSVEKTAFAALMAAKEETEKAYKNTEIRFAGVNEWRNTVQDLISGSIPRKEVEARDKALNDKLDALTTRLASIEAVSVGRKNDWTGLSNVLMMLIALAAVIVAFLKH